MKVGKAITIWCTLLGLMALAAASTAHAEVAFTPPQTLDGPDTVPPQVAVDPQGRPTFVWEALGPEGKTILIKAVRLSAAGLPGPVHILAAVPNFSSPRCICPRLAVDPSGRATAVWQTITKEGRRIESAQIDAEGAPEPARILSPPEVEGWYAQVAANSDGEVTVVWNTSGVGEQVEALEIGPEGALGEIHPVAKGGYPTIAVGGPDGRFHVSWTGNGVETTRLDEEGAPEEIHTVSPKGGGASDIVVDSKGRPTVAWWSGLGSHETKAVRLDLDGTPGPVRDLSPPGQKTFEPRLAVDAQDRVTAVWQSWKEQVFSVRLDEDGMPGGVQHLSPEAAGPAGGVQLTAAPDGRVVVVWNYPLPFYSPEDHCQDLELKPDADVVRAAFIGADGQLQRVLEVSPFGQESWGAEVALDPLGLPWVSWGSFDGTYTCPDTSVRVHASHALSIPPPEEGEEETPAPPPAPPAPPQQSAALRLAKRAATKGNQIALRARCQGPATGACSGTLRIGAPRLALARGPYRIPAGQAKTLFLPLTKAAKSFLAKGERRWLATKARGPAVTATTVLVRVTGANP
jgi:hypothetical protein